MNKFKSYTTEKVYNQIKNYDSLVSMWNHSRLAYSGRIAVQDKDTEYTYTELNNRVMQLRYNLYQLGVRKGDRVGIHMKNSLEFIALYLAIATLGAVAVLCPIHWNLAQIGEMQDKLNVRLVLNQNDVQKLNEEGEIRCQHITPDMPCTIIFTSGTEGKPKGVVLSHQAIMAGIQNGCYGLQEVFRQVYLLILPLTHVFGLIRSCLTALYSGSTVCIAHGKQQLFNDIEQYQPTVLVLVPALVEIILKASRHNHKNMFGPKLKYIICGAATVAPRLIRQCARMGVSLYPGYGLTEAANLVSGNPEPLKHSDSVGYVYDNLQCKIVNQELYLKGSSIFMGYATFDGIDNSCFHDGWFATGDLAKFDEDGFLILLGRKKDIIIRSNGENVAPAELENFFLSSHLIQDCLVYEYKTWFTDKLVLEVLPSDDAKTLPDMKRAIVAVIKTMNTQLPSYKQINKIIIRKKDFDRSESMKVLRNQGQRSK